MAGWYKGGRMWSDFTWICEERSSVVGSAGYTRDAPFVMPSWREGDERPVVLNSYLDGEGNRVHIVWQSNAAGPSRVVDIIDDAPSLEKVRADAADACGGVDAFHEMMQAILSARASII